VVSSSVTQQPPSGGTNVGEIYVKGKWVAVPAINVADKTIVVRGSLLKIAVVRSEDWLATELENPEDCLARLKEQSSPGLRADIFTFTQKLPNTTPKYNNYPIEYDSVAAVHLTSFKEWWEGLPQETRKNVRRSQKRGVVVEVRPFDDVVIQGLVELNNDSPTRQGQKNDQFGITSDEVKRNYSSFLDRSDCVCAFYETELVGFLKIVYRGEVASILNLLPKARHADKRPANALVAKAMELCAAKGVSHVTYGLYNYGNKQDSPLREFKIRNGFSEFLVPRYYIPLTIWGRACMKARLHLGLLGILPHSVITFANQMRTRWYNFK